jgi:hypothetical protein
MGRRRRRSADLRRGAWFLAASGLLIAGLVVGAHLFDDPDRADPSRSLEHDDVGAVAPPATWDRIRVEVLNAGGIRGMAARARDELRSAGFDVVFYGNAATFDEAETRVVARTGSLESARAVMEALGVGVVESSPDTTRFVDVTVLLGTDWTGKTAPEPDTSGEDGDEEAWWDLRRLLP